MIRQSRGVDVLRDLKNKTSFQIQTRVQGIANHIKALAIKQMQTLC